MALALKSRKPTEVNQGIYPLTPKPVLAEDQRWMDW